MCHGIVGEHRGTLTAANRPEGGARFVVALPLVELPVAELVAAP